MSYGNVFAVGSKEYPSGSRPVWLSVDERKTSGGIKTAGKLAKGTIIRGGTPVGLSKMGGELEVMEEFKVLANSTGAVGTTVVLPIGSFGTEPAAGLILGKIDPATGIAAVAGKLGTVTSFGGIYTCNIDTNLGALVAGDNLVVLPSTGSNIAVNFKPTGLTWHDAYFAEDSSDAWTAAVVTKGQILEDAIPVIPAFIKKQLIGITFEKEV